MKTVMGDFFTALWVISFFVFVTGLIKPSLFKFLFKENTSRKVVGLTLGGVATVFLFAAGALAKPEPEKPKPAATPKPIVTTSPKPTSTPTLSPKEIKQREKEAKKQAEQAAEQAAKQVADKLVVTSTTVKKVNGRYQYWFDVQNTSDKPVTGLIDVTLVVKKAGYNLAGGGTIDLKDLQPGLHQVGYREEKVGTSEAFGDSAVKGFSYKIYLQSPKGKNYEYPEKTITTKYEDTDSYY